MKSTLRNALFSGILALAFVATPAAFAQTNSATEGAKKPSYPFNGKVASVDNTAKTVTLKKKTGERVLYIDSSSKLIVEGKPATLSEVKPDLYAHGTLHKGNGTNEYIISAKFDIEAPAKKGDTNSVPTPADPNAPVKKHKKKPATDGSTNSVPAQ